MQKILILILIITTLLTAAGEKEFGSLLNDLSISLNTLAVKVEKAKNAGELAKALKQFCKESKPLSNRKKKLEKAHPALFQTDTELPSSVIPQAEKLAKSSERYNEAMAYRVDLMDADEVQGALEESETVLQEFSSLLGSEEEELEDEEE